MNAKGHKYGDPVPRERFTINHNLDSDGEADSLQSRGIEGADFETAVTATGYGKFNHLLLLGLFLPCWGSIFDVSNMSMILPSAECDLELTLFHKGVLNGIVYAGTISTAILWGFLSDVYGRRKLLIFGFLADALLNILSGCAQNFWVLLFFKYTSGCIINGPYAIMMCYCAEFQGGRHRGRVMLFLGLFATIGNIAVPVLAWSIIPQTWKIELFDGMFVYNSWRLYLTLGGIPTLVGLIAIKFFPESPKFLMSQGRNEEALTIFRKMYTMNTGKPSEQYPVVSLEDELEISDSVKPEKTTMIDSKKTAPQPKNESVSKKIGDGLKQMKPLFCTPHVLRLLLVVSIQFGGMLSLNTVRLWLPQLFSILNGSSRSEQGANLESQTFCQILDFEMSLVKNATLKGYSNSTTSSEKPHCEYIEVDESVYINIMIISAVAVLGYLLMSTLINVLGKKNILYVCYGVSLISAASIIWSSNTILTLFLSCLFVGLTNISVNSMIAVTVDLFPTSLRTMSVSLIMMIGRSGSLAGNLLFPVLLLRGCIAPLFAIAGLLLGCLILTTFIPKPTGGLK